MAGMFLIRFSGLYLLDIDRAFAHQIYLANWHDERNSKYARDLMGDYLFKKCFLGWYWLTCGLSMLDI